MFLRTSFLVQGTPAMQCRRRLPQIAAASTAILGLVMGLGASAATAAPERVGFCGATNPSASGTPPGDGPRQLVIGQDVTLHEHIVTGPDGQVLIWFLDQSTMSVGPNSDVVVDEFVFDPKTSTGKLTLSAARGVLRYVGGKISKAENAVSLHTDVGTIGVRGGVFLAAIAPHGGLNVVSLEGQGPTVAGRSGPPQTLAHPVNIVTIAGPGAAASAPVPLSAESWQRFVAQAGAPKSELVAATSLSK